MYEYHLTGKWTGMERLAVEWTVEGHGMYSWRHHCVIDSSSLVCRSWRIDIDINSKLNVHNCHLANSAVCYWYLKDNSVQGMTLRTWMTSTRTILAVMVYWSNFTPVSLPRSLYFGCQCRYKGDTWFCSQHCQNRIQSKIQSWSLSSLVTSGFLGMLANMKAG